LPGRLADVTVALSLATDLGTGQPMEHGLRTCWLSLRTAEALGLDSTTRSCVYHTALLRFIGCTSDAAETAALAGGDDLAFNETMAPMLMGQSVEATRYFVRHLGEELSVRDRAGRVVRALADPGASARSLSQHCEVGARLATRLGVGDGVCVALAHAYERWDGRGAPAGLAGDDVPVAVRVVTVARDVELWSRRADWPATTAVLSQRRGRAYEPAVVDALLADGERWLAEAGDDVGAMVLDAEPTPVLTIGASGLDGVLAAIADFTDIKSPWLRGHSTHVARLVADAAGHAGLSGTQATEAARAALLHDVGRVGVPNGIWDRAGPLTAAQWERVRLHPYLTERVLQRAPMLTQFSVVAAGHHERADGSGYHRASHAAEQVPAARLLAAADAYHAMTEDRPHRAALSEHDAAAQLCADLEAGRFGHRQVDAVLAAAGEARPRRPAANPAGLTDREVEVLRLIARGRVNKQVAAKLGISAKTVGRHVEHIYAKAGVTTRAGATLFAMEHGLLTSG